jgi:hypothetical protein
MRKRLDLRAIDSDALRQAQALRRQAVNERQQGLLGRACRRQPQGHPPDDLACTGRYPALRRSGAGQAATIYGQYQTFNRRTS